MRTTKTTQDVKRLVERDTLREFLVKSPGTPVRFYLNLPTHISQWLDEYVSSQTFHKAFGNKDEVGKIAKICIAAKLGQETVFQHLKSFNVLADIIILLLAKYGHLPLLKKIYQTTPKLILQTAAMRMLSITWPVALFSSYEYDYIVYSEIRLLYIAAKYGRKDVVNWLLDTVKCDSEKLSEWCPNERGLHTFKNNMHSPFGAAVEMRHFNIARKLHAATNQEIPQDLKKILIVLAKRRNPNAYCWLFKELKLGVPKHRELLLGVVLHSNLCNNDPDMFSVILNSIPTTAIGPDYHIFITTLNLIFNTIFNTWWDDRDDFRNQRYAWRNYPNPRWYARHRRIMENYRRIMEIFLKKFPKCLTTERKENLLCAGFMRNPAIEALSNTTTSPCGEPIISAQNIIELGCTPRQSFRWLALNPNPRRLISLDLRWNGLYGLSPKQWVDFWAGVKCGGWTSLDLRWNFLGKLSPKEWVTFKEGLSGSGLVKLNVSGNHLTESRECELASILDYNYKNPFSETGRTPSSLFKQCSFFVAHTENYPEIKTALANELHAVCEQVRTTTGLGL